MASLIAGRNPAPLTEKEVQRVTDTAFAYEPTVTFKYDATATTAFHVRVDPLTNDEYGEVVFGPDIYPGTNVVVANAMIGIEGAIAHELQHYHRWRERSVLQQPALEHLDEALTSLQAIGRYRRLSDDEIQRLVADAIQRIGLFIASVGAARAEAARPAPG
jgi:hypothetical protein